MARSGLSFVHCALQIANQIAGKLPLCRLKSRVLASPTPTRLKLIDHRKDISEIFISWALRKHEVIKGFKPG